MKKYCIIVIFWIALSIPRAVVHADIIVNEIAWMGTTTSANAEWIELYNTAPTEVSLEGWKLSATDGSPNINLTGVISASGYYVLERTSDETLPAITANLIYSGALGNTGEHLQLKDNLENIADDLDMANAWAGGDNTTKQTMQRNGSAWVTGAGTPGAQNITSSSNQNDTSTNTESSNTTANNSTPVTIKTVAVDTNADDVELVKPDPKYTARVVVQDYGTAGVAIPMSVIVKQDGKRNMVDGRFEWSMGDGKSYTFLQNTDLKHVFYYPGEYTITLTYYSNNLKTESDSIHKKVITIVPHAISIVDINNDGGIVFHNSANKDIDLGNWIVSNGISEYVFPKYTIVTKGKDLSIAGNTTGFTSWKRSVSMNPDRIAIDIYPHPTDEVAVGDPDVQESFAEKISEPIITKTPNPPIEKSFGEIMKGYLWYAIFGLILLVVIVAYLLSKQYASSTTDAEFTDSGDVEPLL